jgi:hypothetical protein
MNACIHAVVIVIFRFVPIANILIPHETHVNTGAYQYSHFTA